MVKYQILTHLPCTAQEYIALKDRPDYKDFQLEIVGAREHSNTRTVEDGWVTQVIINKPDIKFPAMLKPLLRGKEIIFTDKRRYRERLYSNCINVSRYYWICYFCVKLWKFVSCHFYVFKVQVLRMYKLYKLLLSFH